MLYSVTIRATSFHIRLPILAAVLAVLVLALAACGGGGGSQAGPEPTVPPTSSEESTSVPAATTASPAFTPVPTASTGGASATAEARSSVPATAAPAATEGPEDTPVPDPTPAMLRPAPVTLPDCGDSFRGMLVENADPATFNVDVVNALNSEFMGLRPDCVERGWAPEFSQEAIVCETTVQGGSAPAIRRQGVRWAEVVDTMAELPPIYGDSGEPEGFWLEVLVHLTRVPFESEIPDDRELAFSRVIGGCWHYRAEEGSAGFWSLSFVGYTRADRAGGMVAGAHTDGVFDSVDDPYPGCERRLQDALSRSLDAGEEVDLPVVLGAVAQVRGEAGGGCPDEVEPLVRGWFPSPVEGPTPGCPGSPVSGLQPDGAYILNFAETWRESFSKPYRDSYGQSACWVRSPDGEWGSYLR